MRFRRWPPPSGRGRNRQWLKDAETGKRRYVERPRSEWQERDAPELRIVDAKTWAAVRRRVDGGAAHGLAFRQARRGGLPTRTLFGGLLRCEACDGPVIAISAMRYGCGVHKDRGDAVCADRHTVPRKAIDSRLVALLHDELLGNDMLAELQAAVRDSLARQRRAIEADGIAARSRLQTLDAEIGRMVEAIVAIVAVGTSPALQAHLRAAERERATLGAALAADRPAASHP